MRQEFSRLPQAQGLYNPDNEKDNCGVGMIANLKKAESHRIVKNALQVHLANATCAALISVGSCHGWS